LSIYVLPAPAGRGNGMIVVLVGPAVESQDFNFVALSDSIGSLVMCAAALLFNNLFEWRAISCAVPPSSVRFRRASRPEDLPHGA